MSLQILTVKKKDGSAAEAGELLINTNRLGVFKTIDTNDTVAEYFEALHTRKAHITKYVFDDTVSTISAAVASLEELVYALSAYVDNNDSNSTETIYINTEEIAKGAVYGADSTKSWLWVEKSPGKVQKYLINKPLQTIVDYANTGTTTTTTTSTSTTSTSTTSTTSTD